MKGKLKEIEGRVCRKGSALILALILLGGVREGRRYDR